MGHGAADVLVEYGPVADRGYRKFLQSKYGTVQAVSRRWLGNPATLGSWEDVRLPELAHFAGWGPEAVDLTGSWRISYDAAWGLASAAPTFDDSTWPTLIAPGHSIVRFLMKTAGRASPASPGEPGLARGAPDGLALPLGPQRHATSQGLGPDQGTRLPSTASRLRRLRPRTRNTTGPPWRSARSLVAGDNLVTLDLPQGMFNYRCYLSAHEPKNYPNLGPELNAQWADYSDFNAWCRGQAVRRGAEMIRQVDPNRPITFMSPDTYAGVIKPVWRRTSAACFTTPATWPASGPTSTAMEMASSGLPTDLEPGSGAVDVPDFKRFMGRWSTEGIQGVDYFQHIGDIEWREAIRAYFLKTLNLWHLIGQVPHAPGAGRHAAQRPPATAAGLPLAAGPRLQLCHGSLARADQRVVAGRTSRWTRSWRSTSSAAMSRSIA